MKAFRQGISVDDLRSEFIVFRREVLTEFRAGVREALDKQVNELQQDMLLQLNALRLDIGLKPSTYGEGNALVHREGPHLTEPVSTPVSQSTGVGAQSRAIDSRSLLLNSNDNDEEQDEEDAPQYVFSARSRGNILTRVKKIVKRVVTLGQKEGEEGLGTNVEEIEPKNKVQEVLLPIITSNSWALFSMIFVIVQCTTLISGIDCLMKTYCVETLHDTAHGIPRHCAYIPAMLRINLAVFTLEMAIKLLAEQRDFFLGPAKAWNIFDAFMWAINVADLFALVPECMTVLRVMRMFRILRLFEVFAELRTMLYSMYACGTSLGWAFLLVGVIMVMVAVYLEDVALLYLQDNTLDQEHIVFLQKHWNGMFSAVVNLIFSITGGADWESLAAPFFSMPTWIPHFHGMIFTLYILFTVFGMINVLIGVFVEKTQDLSDVSREAALSRALTKVKTNAEHVHDLFDEFPKDNENFITREEIINGLKMPRIQAHFCHLGIDFVRPNLMLQLFDSDHSGTVDRKEFVKGCQRLQGSAKPAEMAEILSLSKKVERRLSQIEAVLDIDKSPNAQLALQSPRPV